MVKSTTGTKQDQNSENNFNENHCFRAKTAMGKVITEWKFRAQTAIIRTAHLWSLLKTIKRRLTLMKNCKLH